MGKVAKVISPQVALVYRVPYNGKGLNPLPFLSESNER